MALAKGPIDNVIPTPCPLDPAVRCAPGANVAGQCCRVVPAGRSQSFSVIRLDHGQWDITTEEIGVVFRLRCGFGAVKVVDARESDYHVLPREPIIFRSLQSAMSWCTDELMAPSTSEPPATGR